MSEFYSRVCRKLSEILRTCIPTDDTALANIVSFFLMQCGKTSVFFFVSNRRRRETRLHSISQAIDLSNLSSLFTLRINCAAFQIQMIEETLLCFFTFYSPPNHIVWKLLKMSHLNFGIIHQFLSY